MLKYRLLVGFPMAAAALGLLSFDPGPVFPGLAILVTLVGLFATAELYKLFPPNEQPPVMAATFVVVLLAANWSPFMFGSRWSAVTWPPVAVTLAASVLLTFAGVVRSYSADGRSGARAANGVFALVYLGVLPAFLVHLRWHPGVGPWAVLATIFVPKVCDIGAYFTGQAFGRHKMAPTLSPKKTWEGFAGGMVASAGTAVGIGFAAPLFPHGPLEAAAFGLVVGAAGVVGDLFESLLKRDAQVKDASAAIPGFGGVLDVIDSILFAAPVAYLWLSLH